MTGDLAQLNDEELAQRPFDELVAELQRIVSGLEGGSAGLEESIALYREGLRLHAACERRLREAELTIAELGRRGLTAADSSARAEPAGTSPNEVTPTARETDEDATE